MENQTDYRNIILDCMSKNGISRNKLAAQLGISAAALHKSLALKQCHLSMELFQKILGALNIQMHLIPETEVPALETLYSQSINESNFGAVVANWYESNQSILDNYEYHSKELDYELQQWIIENNHCEQLARSLTSQERDRLNEICHNQKFKTYTDKIKFAHSINKIVKLNSFELLNIAVKCCVREYIGSNNIELRKTDFPGNFNWNLINIEQVPF